VTLAASSTITDLVAEYRRRPRIEGNRDRRSTQCERLGVGPPGPVLRRPRKYAEALPEPPPHLHGAASLSAAVARPGVAKGRASSGVAPATKARACSTLMSGAV